MPSKTRKLLRKLLLTFVYLSFFLVCFYVALHWLFHSEAGAELALETVNSINPEKLTYTKISGTLSDLDLQNVRYISRGTIWQVGHFHLSWHPKAIIYKWKLHFTHLTLENINIETLPTKTSPATILSKKPITQPNSSSTSSWFDKYQLAFAIDDLTITKLHWKSRINNTLHNIDKITLQITSQNGTSSVTAALLAKSVNLGIHGQIAPTYALTWQANLSNLHDINPVWQGSLKATGSVSGNKKKPVISITLDGNKLAQNKNKIESLQTALVLNLKTLNQSSFYCSLREVNFAPYFINKINIKSSWQKQVGTDNDLLTLSLAPTNLSLPVGDTINTLTIPEANLEALFIKQQLDLKLLLHLANQKPLIATLTVPNYQKRQPLAKHELRATLKWTSTNLAPLSFLLPDLKNPSGNLILNYNAKGNFAKPDLVGSTALTNFKGDIPKLGLHLINSSIKININHYNIDYNALLHSGNGLVNIQGGSKLDNLGNSNTLLKISGENFLLSNTQGAYLVVSPKLELKSNDKRIELTGDVQVPEGRIRPEYDGDIATLPKEVVFVTENQEATEPWQPQIYSKLNVFLGDNVTIKLSGLRGYLNGKLQINDTPDNTTANGILTITKGSYKLYGQTLTISDGKLTFIDSAITNPNINLTATKIFQQSEISSSWQNKSSNLDNLTIGLHIQGNLDRLTTTLISSPITLTPADSLSYLLLGQPASQAGDNKASLLFNAAKTLNVSGLGEVSHMTDQLRKTFGLSKLGIESQSVINNDTPDTASTAIKLLPQNGTGTSSNVATTTALALGKYLSPKFYIGYSYRVSDQVNVFKINYILNKSWTIQSETSTVSKSMDLLYRIERN